MMSGRFLTPLTGWIIISAFSALWLLLGWLWGRRSHTFDSHVLAGRNIGLALGTATAMATWVTSNTTMAAPQLAYQLGIWGMIGYSLGAGGLILFAPLAERIKVLMPNGYTSGDFVRVRYGRSAWIVFLLISIGYGMGWLVSMGMAGGVLLEALTGIDYKVGMVVITTVCTGYTLLGGMRAVVGTDFIQSVLILVGLTAVGVTAFNAVDTTTIHRALAADRPELLNVLMPASIMFLFNNLLFGVGEIFHSNVWWSRALAFRQGMGFRAYTIAGCAWIPVPIAAGAIALAAPVLGVNVPALDMVGPIVAGKLLGGPGAVLILIVVFSSLASSLDSLLAATSDLIVEDIYRGLIAPKASDRQLQIASRFVVLGLGALSIALCWGKLTTLAQMIHFTGAFVASTIWPIATGLYWTSVNRKAATAAMLLGSGTGLIAYFSLGFYTAALVSASVSMACLLLGTWRSPESFYWRQLTEVGLPSASQLADKSRNFPDSEENR